VLLHLFVSGPARLDEPLRVYFTAYRVLRAMQQDASAGDMLRTAYEMMHRFADGLAEDQRALFFEAVPLHRVIDAAWAARKTTDE
jgi:hypothetical protein